MLIVLSRRDTIIVRHYIAVTVRPILERENGPKGVSWRLPLRLGIAWDIAAITAADRVVGETRRWRLAVLACRKERMCAVDKQSAIGSLQMRRQPSSYPIAPLPGHGES